MTCTNFGIEKNGQNAQNTSESGAKLS